MSKTEMVTLPREGGAQDEMCDRCDQPIHPGAPCEEVSQAAADRLAAGEARSEPVAVITECEACFTPDVCQLRGTCDHYSAEWLRIAAPPPCAPQPSDGWRQECDDTDALLRHLGLDPERCRTEGGSLNLPRIKTMLVELHTLRCKVCGDGWRLSRDVCFGSAPPQPAEPTDQMIEAAKIALQQTPTTLGSGPYSEDEFCRRAAYNMLVAAMGSNVKTEEETLLHLVTICCQTGA